MVRQLQPFHGNLKKRLVKTPKVYLRDSGILHTLLGIDTFDELLANSVVGMSWEGFCLEQILNKMPRRWEAFFYRTQAGAEIDLVLLPKFGEAPILVEFKHSHTPKLAKGFWAAKEDLQPQASFIVYPGESAYPIAESVEVISPGMIDKIWSADKGEVAGSKINGY